MRDGSKRSLRRYSAAKHNPIARALRVLGSRRIPTAKLYKRKVKHVKNVVEE
jgi:hypothetical protein